MSNKNQQLVTAAENGETVKVKQLLSEGANINTQDDQGRTPVMAATYKNRVETVRALIEAGADINKQDNMKNNPFLYAGAEGYLEILKLVNAANPDLSLRNRYGGNALIPACEHGYVDVVRYLLTNTKIDPNHINNLGWTGLLEAIILNNGGETQQQVVRLLIEHRADVNIADKEGVTPLSHARSRGFTEIEKLLVQAGAR